MERYFGREIGVLSELGWHLKSVVLIGPMASTFPNFRGALIESFIEKGYQVHAVAPDFSKDVPASQWLSGRGVYMHEVPLSRTGLNPIGDLGFAWAVMGVLRRVRPHILLGYTIKPVIWGLLAAKVARVPKRVGLITGLGYAFTGEPRGLRFVIKVIAKMLYRWGLRQANLVFFQNPDDYEDFRKWRILPETVPVCVVNGSGVDTDAFLTTPFELGPCRFLLIARLLADKGIYEYIAAIRSLRAKGVEASFDLVGGLDPNPSGISKDEVANWVAEGLITWHGAVSDVRPYIARAHVYVLPSYREGTPRTVLEAMAMGRPIITTDAPGCRQTVHQNENGLLIPVQDHSALEKAMMYFVVNRHMVCEMGEISRQIAVQRYDVHKVNACMHSAIENI